MGRMELCWFLGWYVKLGSCDDDNDPRLISDTADSFNINTWMISSANIVDGLSWWQSWICVWV